VKENAMLPKLSKIPKRVMLAILVAAVGGCKGSIEGKVFGTDSEPAVPVSGHPVYLVAASPETAAALKAVCPAMSTAELAAQADAERRRFNSLSVSYGDSLHGELVSRRDRAEVARLRGLMALYHDSATSVVAQLPGVPVSLIETLAMKRVPSDDDGRYVFSDVPPGRYLVTVELRDEYRWLPVQVARSKSAANVSPRGSKEGCEVARAL
jgi:hypothetical protein